MMMKEYQEEEETEERDSSREDAKQQKVKGNEFDLNVLVERIEEDQVVLDELQEKELILFLGTTNAGKTTTICFLGNRGSGLRMKQDVIYDPDGYEMLGEEIIDTAVADEEFRIGHDYQSTTSAIHVCDLPESDMKLVDSCGFQDTEGCIVDIANAIVLRNAMKLSRSFRPVIVIDANILGLDKGVPFSQFLKLLMRFFSPVNDFLSSLSFLFTHVRPDANCDAIKRALAKLCGAPHVNRDPELRDLVKFLYNYFVKNLTHSVLHPNEIASPSPAEVDARRREVLDLILQSVPLSQDLTSTLGCPLSSEAQTSIKERCQERRIEILCHLNSHRYSAALTPLRQLEVLCLSLDLDVVTEIAEDCRSRVMSHLENLFESADSNLATRHYQQLADDLSRCFEAKYLQSIFDVSGALQSRKLALNTRVREISEAISAKGQNPFDSRDCDLLKQLQEIRDFLTFFLPTTQHQLQGYDAILGHIKCLFSESGARSISTLKSLELFLSSDHSFPDELLTVNHASPSVPHHHREEEMRPSSAFSHPLLVLFHDLAFLKSAHFIEDHLGPELIFLYTNSQNHLIGVLEASHTMIFGENGFIPNIAHLTWSATMSAEVAQLYDFLKTCYSVGADDHVDGKLSSLPMKFLNGIEGALREHLSLIDDCLVNQRYRDMALPLKVMTMVQLDNESYRSFQIGCVEKKILSVQESVKKISAEGYQMLSLVAEKDFVDYVEYEIISKLMTRLCEACCLDFLYTGLLSCDHDSHQAPPTTLLATLVSMSSRDWSGRVSQLLESLSANHFSNLTSIFLRLDCMEPLWDFLSEMRENILHISSLLEHTFESFLVEPTIPVADVSDQLRRCDFLLDLSSHYSASRLFRRCLVDATDWSKKQKEALTKWKELTILHLQARLDLAKSRLKEAIQKRDARAVDEELNCLAQHRCLDSYLHPTASDIYNDARNSVKFELLSLAQSGARALSRGDLNKSNSILQFLEGSTIYGTHIEGVDFQSIVGSLLSENRQVLERLPEEILSLLEKRKFQNISTKLSLVRKEDPSTYEECDPLITQYFRRLFDSLPTFSSKDLVTLMDFSSDRLSILKDASVLLGEISYDLRNPLEQILNLLQLQFTKMRGRIVRYLGNYKFEQASELFDQLMSFKSLDCHLLELHDLLEINSHSMEMFQTQIDEFTKTSIVSLPEKLILECQTYLPSPMFLDEGQVEDKNDHLISVNIPNVNRLMRGIENSSDDIIFQDLVDFSSLKNELLRVISEHFDRSLSQIKLAISRYELDLAESLIFQANSLLPCFHHLDLHRHSEASRLLKNQEQALQSATSVMSRSRITALGVESIGGISSELKNLRSDRYDHYLELYREYSNCLREEIAKCKPLLVREVNGISCELISASSFLELIRAVRVIRQSSLLILDRQVDADLDKSCVEIISKFEPFVSKYLELLAQRPELDNLQEVQQVMIDFQQLLPQLVREQLIEEDCERRWNLSANRFSEWVTGMQTQWNQDLQALSQYDLFLSKDPAILFESYQILRKQNQFGTTAFEELSKKFSSARGRFMEYFANGEFAIAAEGLRCILRLKSLSELENICTELHQAFQQFLQNHMMTLVATLKDEFSMRNYKTTNKLIQDVSSFEDNFRSLVDREHLPDIMREIVALFQQELNSISARSEYRCSLAEHAENVILMKSLVSDISHRDIEKLAERSIGEYFARQGSIDFYKLGLILAQSGPIGEQLTECYPQFKSLLTQRFNELTAGISIDHALQELSRLNPKITKDQISKLSEAHRRFSSEFEKYLRMYFPGYTSFKPRPLEEFVAKIRHRASFCTTPTAVDYVDLLAWVFALWAIISSQSSSNEIFDRSLLIKPHPVQLIAIFRLLGLDHIDSFWSSFGSLFSRPDSSVPGHLIQVGTGEGKSILLGGLAAVLSLLGYEVYCASYSQHLSGRDYEAFEPLFEMLGVDSRIRYSTLGDLAEDLINFQGDIRSATKNFLLSSNTSTTSRPARRTEKRILLLDEVDVFFSPAFFGRTYNPATSYFSPDTKAILEYIWDHRQEGVDLTRIRSLPEYNNLVSVCNPAVIQLLEREVSSMLRDVNKFSDPPYELVTHADGRMEIGYKILDSVCFGTQYGYKKAFAYLHEASRHQIDLSTHRTEFSLNIGCGSFSYSELPKWAFKGIIGVTGTLSSLSPAEQKIIADEYNLKTYTYTPSMYGESKLSFKKDSHVLMETDVNRFHQTILKDIVDETQLGRPVLVYFESEEKLNEFRSSEYGQRLADVNIVTEKTENLPFYVTKATEAGKVTLFPRVFGRGLDFISRDTAVDAAGGVHVIQTFFSEFLSEEIQIRGRTARQSKRGSYKMILLSSDLVKLGLGLNSNEVHRLQQDSSFYDKLSAKRDEKVAHDLGKVLGRQQQAGESHRRSIELRSMILEPGSVSPQEIVNRLLTF